MDFVRTCFDNFYNLLKSRLFYVTQKDPEIAHDLFVLGSRILNILSLEKLFLDNRENYLHLPFEISSAAGVDKNARVHPRIFKYLGFDRIVIGTVTGKYWPGHPRPRIKRNLLEKSLINQIGWNNDGAEIIAERLKSYGDHRVPTTINIGPTPNPKLSVEERIEDVEKTIKNFKDIPNVHRFEYCPSCPNIDITKEENQRLLGKLVSFIQSRIYPKQDLYVKISPDLNEKEIDETINATYDFVRGYVTTNTTIRHDYRTGGGSGNILYPHSLETQKRFYEILKDTEKKIIACGGIDSIEKVKERLSLGAEEIQLYTPLIFSGPKLLREFRSIKNNLPKIF